MADTVPEIPADRVTQVTEQCRVVAHLATVVAELYTHQTRLFEEVPAHAVLADMIGERTAVLMEYLGDHISDIDAVDDSDEWVNPIFAKMHVMFKDALAAPPSREWRTIDSEAAKAEARVRELEAALRPFAEAMRKHDDPGVSDLYDEQPVGWVTLGDFRRARTALRNQNKDGDI